LFAQIIVIIIIVVIIMQELIIHAWSKKVRFRVLAVTRWREGSRVLYLLTRLNKWEGEFLIVSGWEVIPGLC